MWMDRLRNSIKLDKEYSLSAYDRPARSMRVRGERDSYIEDLKHWISEWLLMGSSKSAKSRYIQKLEHKDIDKDVEYQEDSRGHVICSIRFNTDLAEFQDENREVQKQKQQQQLEKIAKNGVRYLQQRLAKDKESGTKIMRYDVQGSSISFLFEVKSSDKEAVTYRKIFERIKSAFEATIRRIFDNQASILNLKNPFEDIEWNLAQDGTVTAVITVNNNERTNPGGIENMNTSDHVCNQVIDVLYKSCESKSAIASPKAKCIESSKTSRGNNTKLIDKVELTFRINK